MAAPALKPPALKPHEIETADDVGTALRLRLAGFMRTLRDNGFKVGLAETNDAVRLLLSPLARRPQELKAAFRALFCGRLSDWQAFDEIFDAYWFAKGMKGIIKTTGTSTKNAASSTSWRSCTVKRRSQTAPQRLISRETERMPMMT